MDRIYKLDNFSKLNHFDINNVRWIKIEDLQLLNQFFKNCNSSFRFSNSEYNTHIDQGIQYCGLFVKGKLIATACVEKFSNDYWDVSDGRVLISERRQGYGKSIACFITKYILEHGRVATCYTKDTNVPAQKAIKSIGFELFMEIDNASDYYSQFVK